MNRRSFMLSLASIPAICLTGCGAPSLSHVTGTVTYDGNPLPAGTISFNPAPSNTEAAQGMAFIKDGSFTTRSDGGRAVMKGAYIVRIKGLDGKFISTDKPNGKVIFDDFTQEVEIPASDVDLNFTVAAKAAS